MEKVIWTEGALADLGQIVEFIARDNPDAAKKLGQNIVEVTKLLASFPKMGGSIRSQSVKTGVFPTKVI